MLFVSPSDIVFFNKLLTSVRLKIPAQNELLHPFANVPQIHGGHAAKTAKNNLKLTYRLLLSTILLMLKLN